jgi:hypothetical protein
VDALRDPHFQRDERLARKRWTDIRRGLNQAETALGQVVDEHTNWSQENDGLFPMDIETLGHMGHLLERFSALKKWLGIL